MSFWVHIPTGEAAWLEAATFTPPKPHPVAGRGYPRYLVEFDGFVFQFASLNELQECVRVLGKKVLPSTIRLSAGRASGPNSHWLSRLPSSVKSWSYRKRAVRYMESALRLWDSESS